MINNSKHLVLRTFLGFVFVLSGIFAVLEDTHDCLKAENFNTLKRCEFTNCPVCGTMSLPPHSLQIAINEYSNSNQDSFYLQTGFKVQLLFVLKEEQTSDLIQFQYPALISLGHSILRV